MTDPASLDEAPAPWTPLVAAALLALVTAWAVAPPAPAPATAPAEAFSAARALGELQRLNPEDAPHPVASPANAAVRGRLVARLRELGLQPTVQAGMSCAKGACSWVENVLARFPGERPGPAVMVAAHYDTRAPAPGAADAGAGVAAALEIARALNVRAPPRDVLFFFDDGEEGGLHGARLFVRTEPRPEVAAVVNLEARGTRGPSTMFETSEGNLDLLRWLGASASRPVASSLFFTVYRLLPNDTDLTVFKAAGMRGLNYAFLDAPANYHTPRDRLDLLDRGSLQHHGQNALDLVRGAGALEGPPATENAIYFDLFGRVLVVFPAAAALPLAILALALVLGRALRRAGPGRVATAVGGQALGLLASIAVVAGTHGLMMQAGAAPARWIAQPGPLLGFQWILGALLATMVSAGLARRVGQAVARDAYWVGLALVGVAAAAATPGLSYLLWIPALVAGLAVAAPERRTLCTWLPWGAFLVLWLPHAVQLYGALGLRMPGLHGLVAWLVAMPLAGASRLGRKPLSLGALAAAGLAGAALLVAKFSPEVPCPLTLRYVESETGARWETLTFLDALPASLLEAAPFQPTGAAYAGLHSRVASFHAKAAPQGLSPPAVTGSRVLEDESGRRWEFRLRSTRGARRLGLTFPAGSTPGEVRVMDQVAFPGAATPLASAQDLFVRLPPGRELPVRVALTPGTPPPRLRVWDITDDLPRGSRPILDARPPWAIQAHDADHTRVERPLPPPGG